MTLERGEALKFQEISWYHFPKTGGTTMRSLLHQVAVAQNYNMTTAYGLKDECTNLPFSCNIGTKPFISYGHLREPYILSDQRLLRIMMIREPHSWLVSRMQHETRKQNGESLGLTAALIKFGPRYFNFLPDDSRERAMRWFNHLVRSDKNSAAISIEGTWELLQSIELDFRSRTFVLTMEYYADSLRLLAAAFDSPRFLPSSNGVSLPKVNEAFTWQASEPAGSLEELKQLSRLLEVHNAIYNLALREFFRQRHLMHI